jgi:hypothetical protein
MIKLIEEILELTNQQQNVQLTTTSQVKRKLSEMSPNTSQASKKFISKEPSHSKNSKKDYTMRVTKTKFVK